MAGALRESHVALTLRATRDSLTGLLNRASLTESLATSFRPGTERRTLQEGVLFIDVDDFKEVNDSLGHHGGDALLIQLASRLNECARPQDLVARLGETSCHCGGRGRCGHCGKYARRANSQQLHEPFSLSNSSVVVSVSIGVAVRLAATADAAELLPTPTLPCTWQRAAARTGSNSSTPPCTTPWLDPQTTKPISGKRSDGARPRRESVALRDAVASLLCLDPSTFGTSDGAFGALYFARQLSAGVVRVGRRTARLL